MTIAIFGGRLREVKGKVEREKRCEIEYNTFVAGLRVSEIAGEVEVQSLYEEMKKVSDGRRERGRRYTAALVLTIILLAKLAGEKSLKGIAEWARLRAGLLSKQLRLKDGKLPCANTYGNICAQINLSELNERLGDFFANVSVAESGKQKAAPLESAQPAVQSAEPAQLAAEPKPGMPTHLALDGKSLRGTRRATSNPKEMVHVVGLYNVTENHMWRQRTVAGKGQERQAAFALIEPLDLHGFVVSADALHTHPTWAHEILQRGGDYLLIAKKNQSELREAIALLFSQTPRPFLFPEQQARTVDKQHGRLEVRSLRVSGQLGEFLSPRWPNVAQVFQIERRITRHGKTTVEVAYGITSLSPQVATPENLLALIRAHWHIENRNHWRRDVTLGEDACRVALRQTPQVLAALNNLVLAIVDRLGLVNLAAATRAFSAHPARALDLLLNPPSTWERLSALV